MTLFHAGDGDVLCDAARVFRRRGLDATAVSAEGPPAREIALLAKSSRSELIAMLTRGRRGVRRALLGSVAEEVLRQVSVPVLLAHPEHPTGSWKIVLAALDGSARAERVLPFAGRLARTAGTPLYLLRAYGPGGGSAARDYLERTCARLERRGIVALPVAKLGSAANAILKHAKDVDAGVVCLTTRGRTGLKRLLMGSVAEEVVRRASSPVIVLRA